MVRASGVVLALAAAALFGLANVAAKSSGLPPLAIAAGSYLIAGVALAPMLRGARVARKDWPVMGAMALVGGAVAPLLLFAGLQRATAVDASMLLTLEMVFTAILAGLVLRERVSRRAWVGFALLLGAALLVAIAGGGGGRSAPVGLGLVALAALSWGVDNMLSARLVGAYRPHHVAAIKGLLGGGALAACLVATGGWEAPSAAQWRALLFIGLGAVALSVVLFYHALQRLGATRTAALTIPSAAVTGAVAGAALLGEPFTPLHGAAVLLVVAGVALASF